MEQKTWVEYLDTRSVMNDMRKPGRLSATYAWFEVANTPSPFTYSQVTHDMEKFMAKYKQPSATMVRQEANRAYVEGQFQYWVGQRSWKYYKCPYGGPSGVQTLFPKGSGEIWRVTFLHSSGEIGVERMDVDADEQDFTVMMPTPPFSDIEPEFVVDALRIVWGRLFNKEELGS